MVAKMEAVTMVNMMKMDRCMMADMEWNTMASSLRIDCTLCSSRAILKMRNRRMMRTAERAPRPPFSAPMLPVNMGCSRVGLEVSTTTKSNTLVVSERYFLKLRAARIFMHISAGWGLGEGACGCGCGCGGEVACDDLGEESTSMTDGKKPIRAAGASAMERER